MKITMRYFASLRERLGVETETLTLGPEIKDLHDLRLMLARRGDVWAEAFAPECALRAAMNQKLAEASSQIIPDAEVAFFPPVTGG